MFDRDDTLYDGFVSYSHADSGWVTDVLLPRLEAAGLRVCLDKRDFAIGVPSVINMEQAVERSRHILAVLTPSWVKSDWTAFESLLAQTSDPIGRRQRLLPLMLQPCEPPARISFLTYVDFTNSAGWDAEFTRLIAAIKGSRPALR